MKHQLAEDVSWSRGCSEDLSNALILADCQCSRLLKPTVFVVAIPACDRSGAGTLAALYADAGLMVALVGVAGARLKGCSRP